MSTPNRSAALTARSLDKVQQATPVLGALAAAARPDLYRRNAFRVAQLTIEAGAHQVEQRLEELRISERLGMPVATAGGLLPMLPPPEPALVQEALQRLRDPVQRLVDEVFWFWPAATASGGANRALSLLASGEVDGAEGCWLQEAGDPPRGPVPLHNLAVLAHAVVLDQEQAAAGGAPAPPTCQLDASWLRAYERWRLLLAGKGFWDLVQERIRRLTDPRLAPDLAVRIRGALPAALLAVQAQLALAAAVSGDRAGAARHIRLARASRLGSGFVTQALRQAIKPACEQLQLLCGAAEQEAARDPAHADLAARRLLRETAGLIATVDDLLAADDPVRSGNRDAVAQKVLGCQVAYGRATGDWQVSAELLAPALGLATSATVRTRIVENAAIVAANR